MSLSYSCAHPSCQSVDESGRRQEVTDGAFPQDNQQLLTGPFGHPAGVAAEFPPKGSEVQHDIRQAIWSELLDLEEVITYRRHHRHPVHA